MSPAKCGDKVTVHVTVWLEDGTNFVSSRDDEPLEFTIGKAEVISAFENAILGMEVGEKKTITISPEDAFGQRHEELVVDVPRSDFPEHIMPVIGEQLKIRMRGSDPIEVTVRDAGEDTVTLDGNHPLAGYTLTYHIQLISIK
jgi:peptidylprolyl isomerase